MWFLNAFKSFFIHYLRSQPSSWWYILCTCIINTTSLSSKFHKYMYVLIIIFIYLSALYLCSNIQCHSTRGLCFDYRARNFFHVLVQGVRILISKKYVRSICRHLCWHCSRVLNAHSEWSMPLFLDSKIRLESVPFTPKVSSRHPENMYIRSQHSTFHSN